MTGAGGASVSEFYESKVKIFFVFGGPGGGVGGRGR